jgi:hypothetical protein
MRVAHSTRNAAGSYFGGRTLDQLPDEKENEEP